MPFENTQSSRNDLSVPPLGPREDSANAVESDMSIQRSTGYALVDEKALQRAILTKIGHELQARSEMTRELPRELLALVMLIDS